MIDKTTMGVTAEPAEVESVLNSLCGYHLAERDPVFRYAVLTREQVLYAALVAAIKRERGRALAELAASGRRLTEIADLTGLGSRQRVHRLIALARAAEEAAAEVQAASRDFDERLAAVEATLDEVVSGLAPTALGDEDDASADEDYAPADEVLAADGEPSPDSLGQDDDEVPAVLAPTKIMPALGAVLHPTKEMPADDAPWWRLGDGSGAA